MCSQLLPCANNIVLFDVLGRVWGLNFLVELNSSTWCLVIKLWMNDPFVNATEILMLQPWFHSSRDSCLMGTRRSNYSLKQKMTWIVLNILLSQMSPKKMELLISNFSFNWKRSFKIIYYQYERMIFDVANLPKHWDLEKQSHVICSLQLNISKREQVSISQATSINCRCPPSFAATE